MKKQHFLLCPLLLMGLFLVFASSCKKDDDADNVGIPVLTTIAVTNITQTTAISGGNITSGGGVSVTARGVCWSTSTNPTISDSKTTDGTEAGSFASSISGLSANTTYHVRAYASNSKGTGYGNTISFTTQQSVITGSFTDTRDGKVYKTVTIDSQEWMAENLAYLPSVVGPATWSYLTPYYYVYGYSDTNVTAAKATSNYTTYGVLYNWPAAMAGSSSSTANPSGVKGVCPTGWHLPSNSEWTQLTDYLGGESVAGGKLKAKTHWNSTNAGVTNETGFTALPGGYRDDGDIFYYCGYYGYWWTTTERINDNARVWYRGMSFIGVDVSSEYDYKESGFSVRCVKD